MKCGRDARQNRLLRLPGRIAIKNKRIRCVVFIIDCKKGSVKLEMADTAVNFSAFIRTAAGRACGCFRFRPLSRALIPFRFSSGKSSFLPFPQETALEGVLAHLHQLDPVWAKSTDYEAPEDVDTLCDRTVPYAENWKPQADTLWAATQAGKKDA